MKIADVIAKANRGEGLTVSEIKLYQKHVKPEVHTYGKYGRLKEKYLDDTGEIIFIENVPEYLHGIDKAADEIWEVMREKLLKDERYCHTGNYLEDIKRENQIKQIIEEEILSELIYV